MVGMESNIQVAIVGGGITGINLALGLLRRNVRPVVYERARSLQEIGAGIGFTANAERAMKALDPRIHQCWRDVATRNIDDWFRYVDAYRHDRDGEETKNAAAYTQDKLICEMYLGERGFEACRRSDFQQQIAGLLPDGCIKFGKNLSSVKDIPGDEKVSVEFDDGSVEQADVVIGCDGINSKMRSIIFGAHTSRPSYSHKFAYRGLIPADEARRVVGADKARGRYMYMGADAHVLTCPVAEGRMVNVAAFVTDRNPWEGEQGRLVRSGSKAQAVDAFSAFGPSVRGLISLLPEELDRWAIFDMYDEPLPTFVRGRVCLAGDAAHASAPHHGAGAGYGVEDALMLAELLASVSNRLLSRSLSSTIPEMLAVYNETRYDRCQALVESSRTVGEMYEWQHAPTRQDAEKFNREFYSRCHRIWDFDVDEMVRGGLQGLEEKLA